MARTQILGMCTLWPWPCRYDRGSRTTCVKYYPDRTSQVGMKLWPRHYVNKRMDRQTERVIPIYPKLCLWGYDNPKQTSTCLAEGPKLFCPNLQRLLEKSYPGEIVPKRNRTQIEWVRFLWRNRTLGTISPEIPYPRYDLSRDIVPSRLKDFNMLLYFLNLYRQYTFFSFKTTWAE